MGVLQTSNMLIWKNFVHAYDILGNKIHTVPAQPARHPKISFSLAFKYAQKMKKNDYLKNISALKYKFKMPRRIQICKTLLIDDGSYLMLVLTYKF